jgi:hypothetical protein
MGLDMYLNKKTYIGATYDHNKITGKITLSNEKGKFPINLKRVTYVIEEVGYWRKANAIHNWFVDNVQDGKDECQESYVETKQLQELLDICLKVSADHSLANELLPTGSGCFFGSTDYDEWYFDNITDTIEILKQVLKEAKEELEKGFYPDFVYQASW